MFTSIVEVSMNGTGNSMHRAAARGIAIVLTLLLWGTAANGLAQSDQQTPPDFRIAFIGDQGSGSGARAVLRLIKDEQTDVVMHQGDFEYENNPTMWENMINEILGPDFPYFACIGNHDERKWDGERGYQWYLQERCKRIGVQWDGDLGVQSTIKYKGICMIFVAPGIRGSGHDAYIRDQLEKDRSIWSIASWHKNMKKMQVGGKDDETGWGVYEEARKGGAIIATAHEHSYSRTHLLSNIQQQTIASTSDTLVLTKGTTFVFVSGIAGKSIRDQEQGGSYWASIYTSDQNAKYGALFGVFNYKGVPNLAHFYFKNIDNEIIDEFWVVSQVESETTAVADTPPSLAARFTLEQNFPNPFNPFTRIRFHAPAQDFVRVIITDVNGRRVRTLYEGETGPGLHTLNWDGRDDQGFQVPSGTYIYRLVSGNQVLARRMILLK